VTPSRHENGLEFDEVSGSVTAVLESAPLRPFAEPVMSFLAALSTAIMKDRDSRRMPDLVSFGYWCRRANLERMAGRYVFDAPVVGRGLAFHIPPTNVPLNFAYSLVCGLLSGNGNILRMSSVDAIEVSKAIALIDSVLAQKEHKAVRDMVCIVKYGHDDEVSSYYSRLANVRIIWGGDATVLHMRSLPTGPRTVDVAFADRTSLALINAAHVNQSAEDELRADAERFYVDGYTFSQNACSSPRLVVWSGDETSVADAKARFWPAVNAVALKRGEIEPIHSMNRLVELCQTLVATNAVTDVHGIQSASARVSISDVTRWQEIASLRFGTFTEATVRDPKEIDRLLDNKVQTLGVMGFGSDELSRIAESAARGGVDRVVPVGTALNFDLVWDGYDLIRTLTRAVSVGTGG
jgi:hypothetical protein